MAPSTFRQAWAISRRYFISFVRYPISSIIRVLLWPAILLTIIGQFLISNAADPEAADTMKTEKFISFILLMTTGFHLWSFTDFIVTDRSVGMKSLMISMGLQRRSWYLGYLLSFTIVVLPVILAIATLSAIYIFVETKTSMVLIYLVFLLFFTQITGVAFAFASMISSSSATFIVALVLVLQGGLHFILVYLMEKVSENLYPLLIFMASISPFEGIKIFCDSYSECKHDCKIGFIDREVYQPVYLTLVFMASWSILFYLFARWFEEVCPWQTDTARKSVCFCFVSNDTKKYDFPTEDDIIQNPVYFEQTQVNNRQIGIKIKKITKSFNKLVALNDLSLNIYKGETTLLLGHNGAGKTTLMNIILGKLTQDQGTIGIHKTSTKCIGVCPQTSVLDQNLTVRQHLDLFVDIKSSNMSAQQRRDHIKKTIEDVSLEGHTKKVPADLSGGMRRKLSLAMAFVGQSDVLILDEPSSGLDPDSRVFIWNAIRNYRKDRTVLLSTQHMEEADYLGDRIAIMAEGRVICCGSSIFLNNVLGNCYKLRIECDRSKEEIIIAFIHKYFPLAKQSSNSRSHHATSELIIELVGDKKTQDLELRLIDMLEYIENNPASVHNIKSFGLKSSSIEDVMHNTSKIRDNDFDRLSADSNTRLTITSTRDHIDRLANASRVIQLSSYETQKSILYALLVKQIQTYMRDWKSLALYRVIIPLWIIWIMMRNLTSLLAYSPVTDQAFLIFHLIYYPTVERVSKFKTMQLTSYASPTTYWLSHFIMDFATVIFLAISMNIMHHFTFTGIYVSSRFTVHLILTLATLLFGICATLIAYIYSSILKDSKACIGYHILLYSTSLMAFLFVQILSFVSTKDVSWLRYLTDYLFLGLLPSDAMQYILTGLTTRCYIRTLSTTYFCNQNPGTSIKQGSLSPIYVGFALLCCQIVAYYVLLRFIEKMNFELSWYFRYQNLISYFKRTPATISTNSTKMQEIDEDVANESARASQLIKHHVPKEGLSLVASGLEKSYIYNKKVINQLSFTVGESECFGLLGVNGAGKSTTFSMLSAEIKPNAGEIWANGDYRHNVYRKELGYDPQSEPETSLSSTEALYLMARLRRLDENCIRDVVTSILDLLQMNEHANKTAKELSGGTKRKLALGMSLIGNPKLPLLDEPTAGVDPMARVDIWSLLRSLRAKNKASIVISSHAMEECEAVCDRIAIMARGRLRCIGTFLHLRAKFSQGCRLKVQLTNSNDPTKTNIIINEINHRLHGLFGESIKLVDTNINSATFNIADNTVKRSAIFRVLRELKQKHSNLYYMLNDSSLEDIFIALAKEQQMQDEQNKRSK